MDEADEKNETDFYLNEIHLVVPYRNESIMYEIKLVVKIILFILIFKDFLYKNGLILKPH